LAESLPAFILAGIKMLSADDLHDGADAHRGDEGCLAAFLLVGTPPLKRLAPLVALEVLEPIDLTKEVMCAQLGGDVVVAILDSRGYGMIGNGN
jgi:hypothetical protein